jgi:hypothetical protein
LSGEGEVLFDQVVPSGQFVKLPPARLVIETDPGCNLNLEDLHKLVQDAPGTQTTSGAWHVNTSIDRLLFALFREAVADIRRVHEAHSRSGEVRPQVLREKFAPWERGQLSNSAGFLLEFSHICDLPETALDLSWQVLEAEASCIDEITAASLAGVPWQRNYPARCLRCAKTASWRPVLSAPDGLIPEAAWRYERPENHVPLCRRCAAWLDWSERGRLRYDLAQGLWGMRFDAFGTWHTAAGKGRLPWDWDKENYPLWPQSFGGDSWATGSGAWKYADPQPPQGVRRTNAHRNALSRILNGKGGLKGKRGRGKFVPWLPLMTLAGIPLAEAA